MSEYQPGMRVRIDEELGGEVDFPYTGVGRLVKFTGTAWDVEVEWLKGQDGDIVSEPGETYTIFESEIAGVLDD